MTKPIDQNTCWYQKDCANEMNRSYDVLIKGQDITKHLEAFTTLLKRTDLKGCPIIDLGCGTAMLSDFCKEFTYHGADLPHILSGAAMRNYRQYFYHACDLTIDD